jgi:hypothetical protein
MSDTGLPQALQLRSRRRIIDDAVQGLGSARGAHLSIRGGRFRLINANGVEKLIDTHYIDVVLIDANDKPARIYFEDTYEPDSDVPPACWSDNGTGPSTQAMVPQAPTCQMCPNNIRGTKQTFTGKATTACENRKKLAFIVPDDPAINVYEFQIPPGSLSNFRDYCKWLDTQASGVEGRAMDVADVVTRVAFDPDRQFIMTFTAVAFADDEQTLQLIQHIDDNHLSDAAVGRNDVACDPEQVKAMIAGRPAQAAVAYNHTPANGQASSAPAPQRQLPPRTQPAPTPTGQEVMPPKPRGRGANRPALPAGNAPAGEPSAASAPATNGAAPANGADPGIPSFLRRNADNTTPAAPAAAPAPKFGVGRAPPPPAEISDALNKAMALPTRRG